MERAQGKILPSSSLKMATVHRAANSVEDVFERLETVRQFVKSRRQIDLSKRDIEFLLEYRDKMIARSDELTRKSCELECVRRILKHEVSFIIIDK